MRSRIFIAALAAILPSVIGPATAADTGDWLAANVPDGFTLTAVGDLIITAPISERMKRTSPDLIKILQEADVTFGNFEGSVLDVPKFDGYPAALTGGNWLLSSPKVPTDLRAMGFNLVSRANNHATDFGVKGMLTTDEYFDNAGIVHGGTGKTLSEARAPQILSLSAGRVSLVAITSSFEADALASDPFGQFAGRPGVNALHTTRYAMVSAEQFSALSKIRDAQPPEFIPKSLLDADAKTASVTLFGAHYKARSRSSDQLTFSFSMDEHDREAFIRSVRQGKETSDFSLVSLHTHEPGNYSREPPDFLVTLAHQAIDNGADAFVMHGPHQLRGIEIYKGKPIFYSLGNFFFMTNTMQPLTHATNMGWTMHVGGVLDVQIDPQPKTEAEYNKAGEGFNDPVWFESVVASSHFNNQGQVTEIRLYPVELNWHSRDADRGIPRIAPSEVAKRVLDRLQALSKSYGTQINIEKDVGIIRPQY
jgi:poly-gamma-glutamate capsule biosynthesis protein CapA/YwtB (metallophosphatase superfamily)